MAFWAICSGFESRPAYHFFLNKKLVCLPTVYVFSHDFLWLEDLAGERSNVGANLSRLEKEIQNLNGKITTWEMAVSRIQDTDFASESTNFASNQIRTQASDAILAQAKDLNVGIRDLIRGIMIGQS